MSQKDSMPQPSAIMLYTTNRASYDVTNKDKQALQELHTCCCMYMYVHVVLYTRTCSTANKIRTIPGIGCILISEVPIHSVQWRV